MKTDNLSSEPVTANGVNTLLEAGFRSNREANRFAKFFALLTIYCFDSCDFEKDDIIVQKGIEYAETEILKMNIPEGWQELSEYNSAKKWFFQACR